MTKKNKKQNNNLYLLGLVLILLVMAYFILNTKKQINNTNIYEEIKLMKVPHRG